VGVAALEQVDRRAGVLADRARRVGARAGGIGHAGEVQDGVAAGDEVARRGVAGVALDEVDVAGLRALARSSAATRWAWPGRTSATTSCPRERRHVAVRQPRNPVAPVTSSLMAG
jgi:hypothetical protein